MLLYVLESEVKKYAGMYVGISPLAVPSSDKITQSLVCFLHPPSLEPLGDSGIQRTGINILITTSRILFFHRGTSLNTWVHGTLMFRSQVLASFLGK